MISAVRELINAAAPVFELRHAHIERASPLVSLNLRNNRLSSTGELLLDALATQLPEGLIMSY